MATIGISTALTRVEIDQGNQSPSPSGTVAGATTAITGTTTTFTSDAIPADVMVVSISGSDEKRVIDTITDNTTLALYQAFSADPAGATYDLLDFSQVLQATNFSGPSQSRSEVDITTYDDQGFKAFIGGFVDPGQSTFELVWRPKLSLHQSLQTDFDAGTVRHWRVWVPDSAAGTAPPDVSNSRIVFAGSMLGFELTAQNEDAWRASITVRNSGALRVNAGIDP